MGQDAAVVAPYACVIRRESALGRCRGKHRATRKLRRRKPPSCGIRTLGQQVEVRTIIRFNWPPLTLSVFESAGVRSRCVCLLSLSFLAFIRGVFSADFLFIFSSLAGFIPAFGNPPVSVPISDNIADHSVGNECFSLLRDFSTFDSA